MTLSSVELAASEINRISMLCGSPDTSSWPGQAQAASDLGNEFEKLLHRRNTRFADQVFETFSDEEIRRIFDCQKHSMPVGPMDWMRTVLSAYSKETRDRLPQVMDAGDLPLSHLSRLQKDFFTLASVLGTRQLERLESLLPSHGLRVVLAQAVQQADLYALTAGLEDPSRPHSGFELGRALSRMTRERRRDAIDAMTDPQREAFRRQLDPAVLTAGKYLSDEDMNAVFSALVNSQPQSDSDFPPAPVRPKEFACHATAEEKGDGGIHWPSDSKLRNGLASPFRTGVRPVHAASYMIVTNNRQATQAGCEVLARGGSAADAAVATQAVLGLAEPQSSGLGGGSMALYYDAAANKLQAYDGREAAPAAAQPNDLRFIDAGLNRTEPLPKTAYSGRAIGVPGVVRMLETMHGDHGKRPWEELFDTAIRMSEEGFPMSARMAGALRVSGAGLRNDVAASRAYFDADGNPKPVGTVLKIPAYGATLRRLAQEGAQAFYTGPMAQAIVDSVQSTEDGRGQPVTPGRMTTADLANYETRRREPVCRPYRDRHEVCGLPPPSSAGIALLETLGVLEHFPLGAFKPADPSREGGWPQLAAVHLMAEAERLAYADRDRYLADTDYVALPGDLSATLLNPGYLAERASLIKPLEAMGTAPAGQFGAEAMGSDHSPEAGTTQISIVDKYGNAVAMTSSIEQAFGSGRMVNGVLLNSQLSDFSAVPHDEEGLPIANRLQGGKRPRATLSSTMVFDRRPDGSRSGLELLTGTPGGGMAVQFVAKTLVGMLDWGMNAQEANSAPNFGAAHDGVVHVWAEHPNIDTAGGGNNDALVGGLRQLGHEAEVTNNHISGICTIQRVVNGDGRTLLRGGADPRREGVVRGDTVAPVPAVEEAHDVVSKQPPSTESQF